MILSASRRTDIPRWYMLWFMNRIRAGYAVMQNPMNASQFFRVDLSPDAVDCIVFWSKDPQPALACLPELDDRGYKYYFQWTLTPYGKDIEPFLRMKGEIEETFVDLSRQIGRNRVVWRYDPIILNSDFTIAWHKAQFLRMCEKIGDYTDTVTISFVDLYAKLHANELHPISTEEMNELAAFIGSTAQKFGLRAVACSEAGDFSAFGVERASCIDQHRIEKILGCALQIPKDKNQRSGCGCCQSIDIGAYNTCPSGCMYCYANNSPKAAKARFLAHDPLAEMISGNVPEGAVIRDRKAESFQTGQIKW